MDDLDLNQFREIFYSEAKEHLSAMNASLLQLEKTPEDTGLLNEIFRAAHTLKGMAATMGFDRITRLTHEMENALDKFRQGRLTATDRTVEVLFSCFDTLEALIDETSSGGESLDIEPVVDSLKSLSQADAPVSAQPQPPAPPPAQPPASPAPAAPVGTPDEPQPREQTPASPKPPETPAQDAESAAARQQVEAIEMHAGKSRTQAVRIRIEYLDRLMNLVGELVINGARLQQIGQDRSIPELSAALTHFNRISIDLQEEVLKTRMVPVKHIFDRYPRMVRDLSKRLEKEIDFQMQGSDIEIDRSLLDEINEPLVHLLRNAVDHGVENPDKRKAAGKAASGLVRLAARRERGYCVIEVSDDGKGIDPEDLRRRAVDKGIVSADEARKLSDAESLMLICSPSFSMAEKVTDVSGRGVGMDVVKHMVESFNGKLDIRSKKGAGTTFVVQLPLTLAIIQALLVSVADRVYAVPLTSVSEIAALDPEAVRTIEGKELLMVRDEVIPLVRLDRVFGAKRAAPAAVETAALPAPEAVPAETDPAEDVPVADGVPALPAEYAVVIEIGGRKTGLIVDSLLGQQQIVIKTFSGILKYAKNFSGATILGDGRVILIIDVAALYGN